MARKKVKLEWIANDSARRATFKKRRKGLVKKASELSTLCDVRACLIVYGPGDTSPAEVWPSPADAARVLARLRRMPEMEQGKKMVDQEGFMRQRIDKMRDQLRKQDKENREMETSLLMYQGLAGRGMRDVRIEDLTSLAWLVEMKVGDVLRRIAAAEAAPPPPPPPPPPEKTALEAAMEELQRQEWFPEVLSTHHQHQQQQESFGMGLLHPYVMDPMNPWYMDPYLPLN